MAIDTRERRRMAIDFGKIRGTGMPIPQGHIFLTSRVHILNLYTEPTVVSNVFFWRNRNLVGGAWKSKSSPVSSWVGKKSTANAWRGRTPPPDGSTQVI